MDHRLRPNNVAHATLQGLHLPAWVGHTSAMPSKGSPFQGKGSIMASNVTSTARTARTAPATPAAPAAPAVVAAPQGSTSTTVAGTPQGQVPHLVMLSTLPVPVALAAPAAAWPGWGKGVRVTGTGWSGTAYANRGNVDLRCTVAVAASIAAQVPGATVRGNGSYVRIPVTATGTPQA